MALTKEQWLQRLKGFVPSWAAREERSEAVFKGVAAVLTKIQEDAEDNVGQTFIDNAEGEYLDQHRIERNKPRLPGETDAAYRTRIKRIVNNSNIVALKQIVDNLLINGTSTIIEHHNASSFLNRSAFLNRNIIGFDVLYNAFTILVNKQIPDATTFLSRESFLNREETLGSNDSSIALFQSIVEAVNKEKAFGTVYRLIERPNEG